MSVVSMVSGSNILELEGQVVSKFSGATKNIAEALEVLWAIKEGDVWKEHLMLNPDGTTRQMFTNFATGYLPYFVEEYGPEMGFDYSVGYVLAKFRLYKLSLEAGATDKFEDILKIQSQYTVESFVRQLESQGESGKEAASELLKQAIEGTVDLNSLRQEAGLYTIRYVVEQGTRKIWVRIPDEGDYYVGDFRHLPNRAWLSFEAKLKPTVIETGEGYE